MAMELGGGGDAFLVNLLLKAPVSSSAVEAFSAILL